MQAHTPPSPVSATHGGSGIGTPLVARRHIDLCRYAGACCRR
ncbi:putative leader peptide [Streptomyces sp. NPDC002790]